jgi:rRNA processing protein Gar1
MEVQFHKDRILRSAQTDILVIRQRVMRLYLPVWIASVQNQNIGRVRAILGIL